MLMRSLSVALLATVMVGGAAVNRADAVVAGPATVDSSVLTDETILNARWICGPTRCEWHAFYPGVQHTWARTWSAPRTPGCVWEKRRGRWREVCPRW